MIKEIDGVLNKEEFYTKLQVKVQDISKDFSLAIINIDNFETVNIYYGENTGDKVIIKVASVLKENLGRNDLIGRYHKDEFYILYDNTNLETAFILVEETREFFDKNTFKIGDKDKEIPLKISAGIANFPRNSKNIFDLFASAEKALLRAKKEGKNKVCLANNENMILKSSYYTKEQLEDLLNLSQRAHKTEASLLREALEDLFKKYNEI